jgi:hypothetical protein
LPHCVRAVWPFSCCPAFTPSAEPPRTHRAAGSRRGRGSAAPRPGG